MHRWFTLLAVLGLPSVLVAENPAVKVMPNITYCKVDEVELQVDLAMPAESEGPFPAIVCLHGGGWRGGHRTDLSKPLPQLNDKSLIEELAAHGYVAMTVSYRLAPDHKFPAQVIDCKTAVRWLRAHAEEYHVNPDKIGAVGFSAGGHLSSMLGCVDPDAELEGTEYLDQSSKVQVVVNWFGPCDIAGYKGGPLEPIFLIPWLGASFADNPDLHKQASPIAYVDKSDAPTLFLHGTEDPLVPLDQSERMLQALKDVGIEAELLIMEGEGHGWMGEKLEQSNQRMMKFFEDHLKQ